MLNQRKKDILELLKENESIKIATLAELCGVSQVTIRKDVAQLEELGMIHRYRGKIGIASQNSRPYYVREDCNLANKRLVAQKAAEMISPNDLIILDAGTTTMLIAELLASEQPHSIVTNSVPVATQLRNTNHVVTMVGGMLLNQSLCCIGPDTEAAFQKIEADKVFIGCSGLRASRGLTTENIIEASTKKAMLHAAKQVIAVFDGSKFEQTALSLFASFDEIDTVITTRPENDNSILEEMRQHGIHIIFADE